MNTHYIKIFILSLFATAFLCACDKDDSAFSGGDCHIASFQLKQGDITLYAAICKGTIVITKPENLSLNGASATVMLSENAKIDPDPASVSNWDSGQTFTVTSHNGTKNTYDYSVQHKVIEKDGDVVLLRQSDVEALAALQLTQLNGSLTIGAASGKDSVYSLASLSSLKTIQRGLYINATYAGEDLAGLENLEKVGALQILQNTKIKTAEFTRLTAVMSDLILNQAKVKILRFPELLNIDKAFTVTSCDMLTMMEFPKLKNIVENLTLTGPYSSNNLQAIDFPALENIGGNISMSSWREVAYVSLPLLKNVKAVSVSSMAKMERLIMPVFKSILGNVAISSNALLTDLDLSSLQNVEGDFKIESCAALENINGVKSLVTINGELFLSSMARLKNIDGLKKLQTVGKRVYLSGLTVLEDETLDALSNLSFIGTDLTILQIPIKRFTGFSLSKVNNLGFYTMSTVEEIDVTNLEIGNTLTLSGLTSPFVLKGKETCDFSLNFTGSAPTFQGFLQVKNFTYSISSRLQNDLSVPIKKVTGDANIGIYNFDNFSMPNLEEVGGKFTLTINTGLLSANFPLLRKTGTASIDVAFLPSFTLPALQEVDGNCSISTGKYQGDNLADLQMPLLITVNGILSLTGYSSYYYNSKLTNLNGFSSLQNVKGITISWNMGLTDFSGLQHAISSFTEVDWKVSNNSYNPSYQDMLDGNYIKP